MVRKYFDALGQFTSRMKKLEVSIVLIGPMPFFPELPKYMVNTFECKQQWFKASDANCWQSIQRQQLVDSNITINKFSKNWENSFDNGYYFEVFDYFCSPEHSNCSNIVDGAIYMYDQDHLNFYGGQLLSFFC